MLVFSETHDCSNLHNINLIQLCDANQFLIGMTAMFGFILFGVGLAIKIFYKEPDEQKRLLDDSGGFKP